MKVYNLLTRCTLMRCSICAGQLLVRPLTTSICRPRYIKTALPVSSFMLTGRHSRYALTKKTMLHEDWGGLYLRQTNSQMVTTQAQKVQHQKSYITELLKFEHFDISGKILISFRCQHCCGGDGGVVSVTSRVVSDVCVREGTVMLRCSSCDQLHIISDHLSICSTLDSSPGMRGEQLVTDAVQRAVKEHTVLRLDKDTLEMMPAGKEEGVGAHVSPDDVRQLASFHKSSRAVVTRLGSSYNILADTDKMGKLSCEHAALAECKEKIPAVVSERDWVALAGKENLHQRCLYYRYIERIQRVRDKSLDSDHSPDVRAEPRANDAVAAAPSSTPVADEQQQQQVGPPRIIYDMGYEGMMSRLEVRETAHQIVKGATWHREQEAGEEPCGMPGPPRVCYMNVETSGRLYRDLYRKGFGKLVEEGGGATGSLSITSAHPLETFPIEKLVFLSPDAEECVPDRYDGDSIYVISSIVDKCTDIPATRDYARQLGARCQVLPIRQHAKQRARVGTWELPLYSVHQILVTWMRGGSWSEAFQHLPPPRTSLAHDSAALVECRVRQQLEERAHLRTLENTIYNCDISDFSSEYLHDYYRGNLRAAYQFGPAFVYDLGYGSYMSANELGCCVHQLDKAFRWNREQGESARLIFSNLGKDGKLRYLLGRRADSPDYVRGGCYGELLREGHSYIDMTDLPPQDLYPRDKLIFLSPDSDEFVPDVYDGESVYVISSIVDIRWTETLTLETARRLGVRCQALPIHQHVTLGESTWELPVDSVLQIMLTWMVTGGDWRSAFTHLPHRVRDPDTGNITALTREQVARRKKKWRQGHSNGGRYSEYRQMMRRLASWRAEEA